MVDVLSKPHFTSGLLKANGIDYLLPPTQRAGVLLNDSLGNLAWGQAPQPASVLPNGDFSVFQIGASPSPSVGGIRYADCWYGVSNSAATFQHNQYTGGQQIGNAWAATMLQVLCVTADASVAAGDFVTINSPVEGYAAQSLLAGSALSFWVAPPATGVQTVALQNKAGTWVYLMSWAVTGGVWNYCTAVIPAFGTAVISTSNMTTNVGLWLYVNQMIGSTYGGTVTGAWQNTAAFGTTAQTNWMATGGQSIYYYGFNLIPGQIPMPFVPRGYDYELKRAMRYRQMLASASGQTVGSGQVIGTTAAYVPYRNAVEMVGAPSLVASSVAAYCIWASNGSTVTTTSLGLSGPSVRSGLIACGVAAVPGVVAGNATVLQQQAAGQLYLEAYPT